MATFCWLPPESVRTSCAGPRVRIPSVSIHSACHRVDPARAHDAEPPGIAGEVHGDVARDAERSGEPFRGPVFAHHAGSLLPAVSGVRPSAVHLERDLTPCDRLESEQRAEQFGPACPDKSGQTENLSAAKIERNIHRFRR